MPAQGITFIIMPVCKLDESAITPIRYGMIICPRPATGKRTAMLFPLS